MTDHPQLPAPPPVRIRLCGDLSVHLGDEARHLRFRGGQTRLLFAYLVLHRHRAVTRPELTEALWGEDAGDHQATLSALLSRLRAALPAGWISGRGPLTCTLPEGAQLDVDAADTALSQAESDLHAGDWEGAWHRAGEAVAILERPLLVGQSTVWLDALRAEHASDLAAALACRAAAGLRLGRGHLREAERSAEQLVALDPLHEPAHVLVMRIRRAAGNPPGALAAYERLRQILAEELGIDPGREAASFHAALLAEDGAPPETVGSPAQEATPASPSVDDLMPGILRVSEHQPMVGRDHEAVRFDQLLERAHSIPVQVMLVTGEPGIGKTRLLAHAARQSLTSGAVVAYGRADEDGLRPYSPLAQPLQELAERLGANERAELVHVGGPDLVRVIPGLAGDAVTGATDAPQLEDRARRVALFDAMSSVVRSASRAFDTPVVLILDDLHWADESALQLLRHLVATASPGDRLVLLLAARPHEMRRHSALLGTVAELQRVTPVHQATLRRLGASQTGVLARQEAGALSAGTVRTIHRDSGGNPFYALELARAAADTADAASNGTTDLPTGVSALVEGRLSRLAEPAQDTLRVAAVLGSRFQLVALWELLDICEEDAESHLVAAAHEGIVAEVSATEWAFAHALTHRAVYETIPRGRRSRLHAAAVTLVAGLPGTSKADAASHALAALPHGDIGQAVAQARRAAAESSAQLAHEQAAALLSQTLQAQQAHAPRDTVLRLELLLDLTDARRRAGLLDEARASAFEAAALARAVDDPTAFGRAALGCGGGDFESAYSDDQVIAVLSEALERQPPADSMLRVQLSTRLAKALHYSLAEDARSRRARFSADALAMARRLGDPRAELVALEGRHAAVSDPDNLPERLDGARRVIRLAAECGDTEQELLGHYYLMADLLEQGESAAAQDLLIEYETLVEQYRAPLHQWYTRRFRATLALLAGRLEEAPALIAESAELGSLVDPATAAMHAGSQTWVLHRELGRVGELEEPIRGFVAAYPAVPAWRLGLTWALWELGRHDEARLVFAEFVDSDFAVIQRDAIWSTTIAMASELACAGLAGRRGLEALLRQIQPYARRNGVTGEALVCTGPMSLYLGDLALRLDRLNEAVEHLEHAADMARHMGARPFLARALRLLEVALETRATGTDRSRAQALFRGRTEDRPGLTTYAAPLSVLARQPRAR